MNITVVGMGYQGLVVSTCLADNGHTVNCVDKDSARIAQLREGIPPIHEPGLEELLVRNIEEERLAFTTDLREAVEKCLIIFLCVGTATSEDGEIDITNVLDAVRDIAEAIPDYRILINKATCPPGTADAIDETLKANCEHPCDVVVNPDFLKQGAAVDEFLRPDRVVVGCDDVRVREILKELYSPFLRTGKPFLVMSRRSAEMTKFATNAMLAARISLMNQLADICVAYGADVADIRETLAADDRIGPTFLFPGLGYGGFGLPKDLATCAKLARDKGLACDVIEAVGAVNERRQRGFLKQILEYYGPELAGKRIAVWGASFKPRTDDLRGAPAVRIIQGLLDAGAHVSVYDPVAGDKLRARFGEQVETPKKYYETLEGAHGLIIVTEWNEFRRPDYARMATLMAEKVIFDGRNLYTPKTMRDNGFRYFSVGRPAV
jgi:UDPglucose 6-dehydrogenase